MRTTAIPLLRELSPCVGVERCRQCQELVLAREACSRPDEHKSCPSRAVVDSRPPFWLKTVALHESGGRLTAMP